MRKPRFDPVRYKYEVGDLIVWKDVIDQRGDEVGIVTDLFADSVEEEEFPIYVVMMPYGQDIITGWDAQFVMEPHDVYLEKKKKLDKSKKDAIMKYGQKK